MEEGSVGGRNIKRVEEVLGELGKVVRFCGGNGKGIKISLRFFVDEDFEAVRERKEKGGEEIREL